MDPGRDEIAEAAPNLLVERIGEKRGALGAAHREAGFRIVRRESTGFSDEGEPAVGHTRYRVDLVCR